MMDQDRDCDVGFKSVKVADKDKGVAVPKPQCQNISTGATNDSVTKPPCVDGILQDISASKMESIEADGVDDSGKSSAKKKNKKEKKHSKSNKHKKRKHSDKSEGTDGVTTNDDPNMHKDLSNNNLSVDVTKKKKKKSKKSKKKSKKSSKDAGKEQIASKSSADDGTALSNIEKESTKISDVAESKISKSKSKASRCEHKKSEHHSDDKKIKSTEDISESACSVLAEKKGEVPKTFAASTSPSKDRHSSSRVSNSSLNESKRHSVKSRIKSPWTRTIDDRNRARSKSGDSKLEKVSRGIESKHKKPVANDRPDIIADDLKNIKITVANIPNDNSMHAAREIKPIKKMTEASKQLSSWGWSSSDEEPLGIPGRDSSASKAEKNKNSSRKSCQEHFSTERSSRKSSSSKTLSDKRINLSDRSLKDEERKASGMMDDKKVNDLAVDKGRTSSRERHLSTSRSRETLADANESVHRPANRGDDREQVHVHSHSRRTQKPDTREFQLRDSHSHDDFSHDSHLRDDHSRDNHSRDGHSRDNYSRDSRSRENHSQERPPHDDHSRDGHSRDGHSRDGHSREHHSSDGHSREGHSRDGNSRDGHSRDSDLHEYHHKSKRRLSAGQRQSDRQQLDEQNSRAKVKRLEAVSSKPSSSGQKCSISDRLLAISNKNSTENAPEAFAVDMFADPKAVENNETRKNSKEPIDLGSKCRNQEVADRDAKDHNSELSKTKKRKKECSPKADQKRPRTKVAKHQSQDEKLIACAKEKGKSIRSSGGADKTNRCASSGANLSTADVGNDSNSNSVEKEMEFDSRHGERSLLKDGAMTEHPDELVRAEADPSALHDKRSGLCRHRNLSGDGKSRLSPVKSKEATSKLVDLRTGLTRKRSSNREASVEGIETFAGKDDIRMGNSETNNVFLRNERTSKSDLRRSERDKNSTGSGSRRDDMKYDERGSDRRFEAATMRVEENRSNDARYKHNEKLRSIEADYRPNERRRSVEADYRSASFERAYSPRMREGSIEGDVGHRSDGSEAGYSPTDRPRSIEADFPISHSSETHSPLRERIHGRPSEIDYPRRNRAISTDYRPRRRSSSFEADYSLNEGRDDIQSENARREKNSRSADKRERSRSIETDYPPISRRRVFDTGYPSGDRGSVDADYPPRPSRRGRDIDYLLRDRSRSGSFETEYTRRTRSPSDSRRSDGSKSPEPLGYGRVQRYRGRYMRPDYARGFRGRNARAPYGQLPFDSNYPNASYPNASYPNASYPNASYPNASYPNALYPNASYPSASYPNTSYPPPLNESSSGAFRGFPNFRGFRGFGERGFPFRGLRGMPRLFRGFNFQYGFDHFAHEWSRYLRGEFDVDAAIGGRRDVTRGMSVETDYTRVGSVAPDRDRSPYASGSNSETRSRSGSTIRDERSAKKSKKQLIKKKPITKKNSRIKGTPSVSRKRIKKKDDKATAKKGLKSISKKDKKKEKNITREAENEKKPIFPTIKGIASSELSGGRDLLAGDSPTSSSSDDEFRPRRVAKDADDATDFLSLKSSAGAATAAAAAGTRDEKPQVATVDDVLSRMVKSGVMSERIVQSYREGIAVSRILTRVKNKFRAMNPQPKPRQIAVMCPNPPSAATVPPPKFDGGEQPEDPGRPSLRVGCEGGAWQVNKLAKALKEVSCWMFMVVTACRSVR